MVALLKQQETESEIKTSGNLTFFLFEILHSDLVFLYSEKYLVRWVFPLFIFKKDNRKYYIKTIQLF